MDNRLKLKRVFKTDEAQIVKDFNELDNYDGYPLIYLGKNSQDTHLIGSLVDVNYESNKATYLHTPITEEQYKKYYIDKEITYRDILLNAKKIYVIEVSDTEEIVYSTSGKELPSEYMPREGSYCPIKEEE